MKVVHICISNPYIDGWGYQENLLPKYMAKSGCEVHVVAASNSLPGYLSQEVKNEIFRKGKNYEFDGIFVHRIPVLPFSESLVIPFHLFSMVKTINPDMIFHHNINPFSLLVSALSKKKGCLLFADNHADDINCSKFFLWRLLYYKCFVRVSCFLISRFVDKYFGVTYSRCAFLHDYFGINGKKIELLPIGADTLLANTIESREQLRNKYKFNLNDRIIVSGGKMGVGKGTDLLMDAIRSLNNQGFDIKLILFGKFEDNETYDKLKQYSFIYFYEWCDRRKTLELLKIGDAACWPIHHTTLCEDAIAVGTPLILRKTETTRHLINNNGCWIENGELEEALVRFFNLDGRKVDEECKKMRSELSYENNVKVLLGLVHLE